jgi:hypothetical protein
MEYLGHLPEADPLFSYLRHEALPRMGTNGRVPDFRVWRVRASNAVYVYEDRHSGKRVIAKFFRGVFGRSQENARRRMDHEYESLTHLRRLGLAGYPHYVARPLGRNAELSCVLVEEFCHGTPFVDFILGAIHRGAREALFQKLTALAYFLATMHNRTARPERVDFDQDSVYFDKIIAELRHREHVGPDGKRELAWLRDRWRERDHMWSDAQVLGPV